MIPAFSTERVDAIRAENPELGIAIYAYEPGGVEQHEDEMFEATAPHEETQILPPAANVADPFRIQQLRNEFRTPPPFWVEFA